MIHLTSALDWSPAMDPTNQSLSSIQESALLYSGHLAVILAEKDPSPLLMSPVLKLSAAKAITSEMPSCVKSFVLPIAHILMTVGHADMLLQMLHGLFDGNSEELGKFLAKWIEYTPKMTGYAKDICYEGLASLLRLTQTNNALGSLKLSKPRPSWMSADAPRQQMML